jgi:peptidoglycan/LPS O-acetylase OafA/YrhL
MDFLAWGALAALFYKEGTANHRIKAALFVGICLVVASTVQVLTGAFIFDRGSLAFGLLAPFFLCMVLIGTSTPKITALLETRWLRYLGRISYGLYLYHVPLFFVINRLVAHGLPLSSAPVKIALAILVASVSFELIEKPLLARKEQFSTAVARASARFST